MSASGKRAFVRMVVKESDMRKRLGTNITHQGDSLAALHMGFGLSAKGMASS